MRDIGIWSNICAVIFLTVCLLASPSDAVAQDEDPDPNCLNITNVTGPSTPISRYDTDDDFFSCTVTTNEIYTEYITCNLMVGDKEVILGTNNRGQEEGACPSDQERLVEWEDNGETVMVTFQCFLPNEIDIDDDVRLVGSVKRGYKEFGENCTAQSVVSDTLKIESSSRGEGDDDTSEDYETVYKTLYAIFEGTDLDLGDDDEDEDTDRRRDEEVNDEDDERRGNSGRRPRLRLNSAVATLEDMMKRVAKNYRPPGMQGRPNGECVPWQLLGAIQEKETNLPSPNNPYFSSTSRELARSTENACLMLDSACPTSQSSFQGGTGGAQGIAQFMPYTWPNNKDSILRSEASLGWVRVNQLQCTAPNPYPHPCNPFAALYAMADKMYRDSGKTTCETNSWTEADVYRSAGRYFGMCVYNGNTYCADIVKKMRDRNYRF